jgi:hypothetical protein
MCNTLWAKAVVLLVASREHLAREFFGPPAFTPAFRPPFIHSAADRLRQFCSNGELIQERLT